MTAILKDFARLRWGLAFLAVAIVAGALMVLLPRNLVETAQDSVNKLTLQMNDIRGRVARASDEEHDLLGRIKRYQELVARGVIGQEERLDWVEHIARIKAARRLLDVQYEIQPQAPISSAALPGGPAAGPYEIMASTMILHMQLLHEDDLLGFLNDLRQHVHAQLLVRECRIARGTGNTSPSGITAQLEADCVIDWVTLREKAT